MATFYILNNNSPHGKIACAPVTAQTSACTKALLDQLDYQTLQQERSTLLSCQLSQRVAAGREQSAGLAVTRCQCNGGMTQPLQCHESEERDAGALINPRLQRHVK